MKAENYFLTLETIEELHVEVTNLCNAACPMCARNHFGAGLRDSPGWGSWQAGEAQSVFSKDLPNLKRVFFCGTHGDPTAAPHLFEAIDACKGRDVRVALYTNGSARSAPWWSQLIERLDESDKIVFGVDGLETNHLYRQRTDINKILRHMKMCCDAKVTTQWDFLAFKHNEHELELCRQKAVELGVDTFTIRKTARFKNDTFPVKNLAGEVTHLLEPPVNRALRHPDFEVMQKISATLPDKYEIRCGYKELRKIYVNSRLEVFPCCYISDENESLRLNSDPTKVQIPLAEMSLKRRTWREILDLPFFRDQLLSSFTTDQALARCIRVCGVVKREQNQEQIVMGSQRI